MATEDLMRWIAILMLLCLGGCRHLDVKSVTFNVNLNLSLPLDKPK
jgi:hypothetical protein